MKRILKKILATTLSIALLLTAVPLIAGALSEEETLKYLDYELFGGEVTITGCDSSVSGDITIPSKIEGYPVTVIGPYAFDFCEQLTGIKIPDSVIGIGELAFFSCTKLKSITIPDSVEYIEQNTFLETAYYNNSANWQSNVLYIGNHLIDAQDLSGTYTIKSGTVTIADNAFFGAKITSITIPNGVKNIGNSAFDNCSKLKDIVIADSVTQIGIDAFYDTAYYNNSNNWENNVLYIGNHLIYANDDISGEYTIKNGTVTIADKAFAFCSDLTKITIPNSVKSICYLAFYSCSSLTNITIPDSVVYIGAEAFRDCSQLTKIAVNTNNKYYCSDSYGILYNKSKSELIQYPIGNTRTSFTIPSSVTYIYADAFNNCNSLTSIVIPDNVSFIGGAAFANCEGIKSIKIGNGIKTIYDGTYYNCINLTSVTIGSGVTDIGQTAFYGCEALESITIPDNVKSINGYAFAGCTKLKNISLGNGIEKIDSSAFGNTAYYGNSSNWKNHVLYIGDYLIDTETDPDSWKVSKLLKGEYTIKNGTKAVAQAAFFYCIELTEVTIPGSVKNVNDKAFLDCINLKSVKIESGVESIGFIAFFGCDNLKQVTIPASVKNIKQYAFGYKSSDEYGNDYVKIPGFKIYCYSGTAGEQYAINNGFDYEIIGSSQSTGDINSDNKINSTDALLVLQCSTGLVTLTDSQKLSADVNKDNKVNSSDALMILQYATGSITSF